MEQDFIDAALKDEKALKKRYRADGKSAGDMYEELAGKWRSGNKYSGASDILDAFSGGQVYSKYRGWGHGRKYYRRRQKKQAEIFAILFEGYATGGDVWRNLEEYYPALTELFENVMKQTAK
jgi:hypothetical protein